ncbi:hypothetical protein F5Y09DRAFT_303777 [Xylaria sp. FL1042]|nr:hypothetical protein F5Y09DRAFT_303777 [Xylaria sp. FL1042]
MAEIAGTALAAVSVGDPLIKAIRGLKRVYRATKNASGSLIELEHTGNTIYIYLSQLDDDIKRNPSKCISVFSQWLEEEKKVLTHSVTEIKDFTSKVQSGLQTSKILGGVCYAMEESEIWKIQNRLASHISILEGMRKICENESIESRGAALELSESKKLRARTTSSLEACSESWCNVSSSMDETCSFDNELPYEEVLKKSKSYTRAAMRKLMSPKNIASEPLLPDVTPTEREVISTSWEAAEHVLAETSDDSNEADLPSSRRPHSHDERSSTHHYTLQLTTSSTHSSSSQPQDSSAYSGWSTQDTTTSISTPMTTQSDEPLNDVGLKAKPHRNQLSVKVEVEGFGYRSMELDELAGENLYDQVIGIISTLRDDVLRSSNKSQLKLSLRPKKQGIIAYETLEESEAGLTLLFNKGFLVGAVEALNNGIYTRLTVFATFILSESDEEQDQTPNTILHELKMDSDKNTQWGSAQFPSIDAVLKLQWNAHSSNSQRSWSLNWISDDFVRSPITSRSMLDLMHDGPEWVEKQAIAKGGSSTVYRVKVSKSHQSLFRGSEVYALKVFKREHEHTFRREVEAYTQLASRNHPHITSLLMAYELEGHSHLLLPWANGSLANLFERCSVDLSPQAISWVGRQCLGLAEALEKIHTTRFNFPSNASTEEPDINYGTHGDIKPDNILWFIGPQGECGETDTLKNLGVLKISDFGLSRLRRRYTKGMSSSLDKRFVGTLAYSAPDPIISRKYDIWSLGVLYLEFVTWLFGGLESLRSFHRARCIDGDGRGYLTNADGSVRLHPSLSDPRSWVRSITNKRLLEEDYPSSANSRCQESFLDTYCHLVQRCLDLDYRRRSSAREVAQHLRVAVSQIQTGLLPINQIIGLDKRLDAHGTSSEAFLEEYALAIRPWTQVTNHLIQTRAFDIQERQPVILLRGVAGAGKSVIARSLANKFREWHVPFFITDISCPLDRGSYGELAKSLMAIAALPANAKNATDPRWPAKNRLQELVRLWFGKDDSSKGDGSKGNSSPAGKVDYKVTAGEYSSESMEPEVSRQRPMSPSQLALAQVWRRILAVQGDVEINATSNFIALGGDSLMELQLANELAKIYSISNPLSLIIRSATLAELDTAIDDLGGALATTHNLYTMRQPLTEQAFAAHNHYFAHKYREECIPGRSHFRPADPVSTNMSALQNHPTGSKPSRRPVEVPTGGSRDHVHTLWEDTGEDISL